MGRVMIKCPKTGEMIPTGISMDEESFRNSRTLQGGRVQCPECGAIHTWSASDAIVVDKEG